MSKLRKIREEVNQVLKIFAISAVSASGAFIDPSGQNQLDYTPLLSKIWDLNDRTKLVNNPFKSVSQKYFILCIIQSQQGTIYISSNKHFFPPNDGQLVGIRVFGRPLKLATTPLSSPTAFPSSLGSLPLCSFNCLNKILLQRYLINCELIFRLLPQPLLPFYVHRWHAKSSKIDAQIRLKFGILKILLDLLCCQGKSNTTWMMLQSILSQGPQGSCERMAWGPWR